jgi:PTH1 family peptidyl-tRNA hydrolase
MDKENIPLENILITDDLNLSFGTIRIKPKEVMAAITDSKTSVLNTNQYTHFDLV